MRLVSVLGQVLHGHESVVGFLVSLSMVRMATYMIGLNSTVSSQFDSRPGGLVRAGRAGIGWK